MLVLSILNFEYLSENKTKFENILTHWSVAQTSWNDEKTRSRKSRWTIPLIPLNREELGTRDNSRDKAHLSVCITKKIVSRSTIAQYDIHFDCEG